MTVISFAADVPPEVGAALERFERQFVYPLGPTRKFRISHGASYLPFFRAMGNATLIAVEERGEILATLVLVERTLVSDDLAAPVHYLCDLKVSPSARGGPGLSRLIAAAREHVLQSESRACYAVVMEGTGRLPVDYTGRLGVPKFERTAAVAILRLSPRDARPNPSITTELNPQELCRLHRKLVGHGMCLPEGDSGLRSVTPPVCLIDPDGRACGMIEDTRRGKRLIDDAGDEMLSAHLSRFAWSDAAVAARLLEAAAARSRELGFEATFVSLPSTRTAEVLPHLRNVDVLRAGATVYGHGLQLGREWWIDTAEI